MSKLLEQAAQSGANEQQVEQIRQNMAALTSSDEQLAAVFARDIQLYHFPLGGALDVGQPVEYEDQVANPFGGQPFPSKAQVVLKEYDPGAGRAVIEWEQTLDPEKSKTILIETLSALARQQGSEAPKEGDLPDPFSIVDTGTFVVDTNAGWVTSLDYQRNATVGPQSEVDITKITDRTE